MKEIKIMTLGDIFDNIETEKKALKFKDYIKNLQSKVEQLEKENKILKENAEHNDKVVDKVNWKNMLLNNIINECSDDILKELKENHHLSYGVALSIRNKLLDYKELKENK